MKQPWTAHETLAAATVAESHSSDVSPVKQVRTLTSGYGLGVRDDEVTPEGAAFAALLYGARTERGLKKDDVIANTSASRSNYWRWEDGQAQRPDLKQVREVCLFLGVNPRAAAVALGLCTNAELNLPPDEPKYDPIVVQIGRIFADPDTSAASRAALTHALEGSLALWRMALNMPEPVEPRGADLARRQQKTR